VLPVRLLGKSVARPGRVIPNAETDAFRVISLSASAETPAVPAETQHVIEQEDKPADNVAKG
jgi:hypothetical protein